MIDPALLEAFCADMQGMGGVLEAPAAMMPQCGGPDGGGMRVDVSEGVYRLIYMENDGIEVLAESPDRNAVMEMVFVHVTEGMASAERSTRMSSDVMDAFLNAPPPLAQIREMALSLHMDVSARQVELLNLLDPEWSRRRAVWAASRVEEIKAFFDPDMEGP